MRQGEMKQGEMRQGGMKQGGMKQGGMKQGEMKQGEMKQGGMKQGEMRQGIGEGQLLLEMVSKPCDKEHPRCWRKRPVEDAYDSYSAEMRQCRH